MVYLLLDRMFYQICDRMFYRVRSNIRSNALSSVSVEYLVRRAEVSGTYEHPVLGLTTAVARTKLARVVACPRQLWRIGNDRTYRMFH